MNPSKCKMVGEDDGCYRMHDGQSEFRVPKKGLSEALHAQIRGMAQGMYMGGPLDPQGISGGLPERKDPGSQFYFDPNQAPVSVSENAPLKPRTTGADLGLGTMPEGAVFSMPAPGPLDKQLPDGMKLAPPLEKTVVETGEKGPDGRPLVKEEVVDIIKPLPAGLSPKQKPGDAPAPQAPPAAAPPKSGPSGPPPGMREIGDATEEGRAAIEAKGNLEAQQAVATAKALAEGDTVMLQHELAQKEMFAKARATTEDLMRKQGQLSQDIINQDSTVDPGRFWASRTTAQKVTGIIGLALGSLGTGPDGINRAAQMLHQAIDRDIDAQKAEHSIRIQRGKMAMDSAQGVYAMNQQLFQNDVAADAATRATYLARINNQVKKAELATAGPIAKANAALLSAKLGLEEGELKNKAGQAAYNGVTARISANSQSAGKGPAGLPAAEQGKLFDVGVATQNIRDDLARAREIIKKSGTFEAGGTSQAELERALSNVAQNSARLADPGSTVKEGELELAKKRIGVKGGEIFSLSNATALKLLDSYERDINKQEENAYAIRGVRRK